MVLLAVAGAIAAVGVPVMGYAIYSGLFSRIEISARAPPVKKLEILYKFSKGAYSNAGKAFQEVMKLTPEERHIGIYYDDPKHVCKD